MPLQATSGAASQDAYGGNGVAVVPTFIEDVFQNWLFNGTGSAQTITNGIDLSTKGGLIWQKVRGTAGYDHVLTDTVTSGTGSLTNFLSSNTTNGFPSNQGAIINSYNTTGFTLGGGSGYSNASGTTNVSWTFRKQPKFFDIQTWTGSGANRTISHSLGSVPASIWVKRTDTTGAWQVYHRSLANTDYLVLNTTAASATGATRWNSTTPTSSVFSLGTDATVNASGGTYVAYVFAHNAGGFGLTGTDNVISCGSYVGTGSNVVVNLGYEPQWVMIKNVTTGGGGYNWLMADNMRGIPMSGNTPLLKANLSDAEDGTSQGHAIELNATGFTVTSPYGALNNSSNTYIYIAIRRGPMKVPTLGTSVFVPTNVSSSGTFTSTANFPIDLIFYGSKSATDKWYWFDRLRDNGNLASNSTAAEEVGYPTNFASNVNFQQTGITGDFSSYISYDLRRSPSFFDVVCYKGDGVGATLNHNLTVVPELIINKSRTIAGDWFVYVPSASATYGNLNTTAAFSSLGSQVATASTYDPISYSNTSTYVSYLFATCAGVSKVGSYTGTGALQTVNCGFTSGARFVLIKRTNSTGDWWTYDSARGITSGNDPYLFLNSTAAEVTSTNYVDTDSTGFKVTAAAPAGLNASGGTYIFLAIA